MILRLLATIVLASSPACADRDLSEQGPGERSTGRSEVAEAEGVRIVFLGTSLTAGLGVDPDSAYPALIQRQLNRAGISATVVNAGVSGETSAGGLRRADWVLKEPFSVLVLELGANDGLRGTDPNETRANLQGIIDLARERAPEAEILLTGMEAPPNLGEGYTGRFRAIFPQLAAQNGVRLIPFILQGVAGHPELNQADRIHPTAAGHRVIARTVWPYLESLL